MVDRRRFDGMEVPGSTKREIRNAIIIKRNPTLVTVSHPYRKSIQYVR